MHKLKYLLDSLAELDAVISKRSRDLDGLKANRERTVISIEAIKSESFYILFNGEDTPDSPETSVEPYATIEEAYKEAKLIGVEEGMTNGTKFTIRDLNNAIRDNGSIQIEAPVKHHPNPSTRKKSRNIPLVKKLRADK